MVVEVVGGIFTNSLALLSDAGHMLTDVIGIGMALAAIHLAGRGSQRSHRTFGWYRLEILAALANAVLLLGVAVYVLVEAIRRFGDPADVLGGPMLVDRHRRSARQPRRLRAAARGLQGVAERGRGLPGGARRHRRVGRRHRRRDHPRSRPAGTWVDPLVGIAIAVWIVPRTIRLAGQALRILVQAAPPGTDIDALRADLAAVDGVVDVHDLHVWTLTSDMDVASAHLMVGASVDQHGVLDRARDLLREHYGIGHATLQVEPEDHTGCDEVGW